MAAAPYLETARLLRKVAIVAAKVAAVIIMAMAGDTATVA